MLTGVAGVIGGALGVELCVEGTVAALGMEVFVVDDRDCSVGSDAVKGLVEFTRIAGLVGLSPFVVVSGAIVNSDTFLFPMNEIYVRQLPG